jgi:hypothetical protein
VAEPERSPHRTSRDADAEWERDLERLVDDVASGWAMSSPTGCRLLPRSPSPCLALGSVEAGGSPTMGGDRGLTRPGACPLSLDWFVCVQLVVLDDDRLRRFGSRTCPSSPCPFLCLETCPDPFHPCEVGLGSTASRSRAEAVALHPSAEPSCRAALTDATLWRKPTASPTRLLTRSSLGGSTRCAWPAATNWSARPSPTT